MPGYTREEYADMLLAYGAAHSNARKARRIYQERYPNRRLPDRDTFPTTYRRFRETGNLNVRVPQAAVRQLPVEIDQQILAAFEEDPTTSTRVVAAALGVSQWKVWSVMHGDHQHPYHYTPVQVLAEEEPSLHVAIPSSSVYNIGEKKAIFCNGSNLLEPLQWISPTNEVVEPKSVRNNRVYVERRQHAGSPSGRIGLIIFSAKFEDSGNWTCKSGDVSKTIDIFVGEKVILNTSESISEDEGKSVRLNCVAKGIPTPEVFWYKNTTPIEEGRKYKIHKISRDYNTQLEIRNLDHSDSAEYVCKVTQGRLLSYTDKRVQLSVLHKPILVTGDDQTPVTTKAKVEEVFAIANEIKVIRCSAIANPLPEYHWTRIKKNGYEEELKPDDEYHKLQKDKNELIQPISVKQGENDQYSELTITMLDPSYTGQYKCTAKNVKGSVEIIYDVSLGNKPNPPDGLELISADINDLVFNVTCSNCTLRLDPASPQTKENLEVLGYTFQFVPFSEGYVADWETPTELQVEIADAENTTFVVGPLPNATTFYVRVASYNAAGNSDWFNVDFTVTTAAATKLLASILLIVIALLFTRY